MGKNKGIKKSFLITIIVMSIGIWCAVIAILYNSGLFEKIFNPTSSENEIIVENALEMDESNIEIEKQRELKKQNREYKNKLGDVLGDINTYANSLTSNCNLISKYWYNGIITNKGIDKSISEGLAKVEQIYKEVDKDNTMNIESARRRIKSNMQQLTNPPDEYKDVYDLTLEIYGDFLKLYELATSPEGTYETYINNVGISNSQIYNNIEKILVIDPHMTIGMLTAEGWEYVNKAK